MISIVIPYWNSEQFLPFLLESLERQETNRLEIILVDDGSEDSSAGICARWKEKTEARREGWTIKLLHQTHVNQSRAMNTGLREVTGDLLFWADSDDVLTTNILPKMAEILYRNDRFGMVRCNAVLFREPDEIYRTAFEPGEYSTELFHDLFLMKAPCLAGTFMVRTSLLRRIYPQLSLPESDCGQNLQLLLPISSITECCTIPDVGLKYRQHDNSDFHSINTLRSVCKRNEDLYDLYMRLIPFCDCDVDKYVRIATDIRESNLKRMIRDISQRM